MDFLAGISLFASMNQVDLDRVAQQATRHNYRKEEPVVWRGEMWPHLLLVEK